jgi:hypothetical protein
MDPNHSEEVVAAKAQPSTESRMAYMRRLSIVFAVELRINIVTELYQRVMSPKQFYEEFGGGSIARVNYNFKKLAEHGWLRYVTNKTGGSRRGATEHFYRTTELAIFDNETWALVPYSMRVEFSWRTFKVFAKRVRDALGAGTLDARDDSHLTWVTMFLDQTGWERVISAIDGLFESLLYEQDDAKLRIAQTGEGPMVATVGLTAFESPRPLGNKRATPSLVEAPKDCPTPFPMRVSKVLSDELCVKILSEANLRDISVPMFRAEFGGDSADGLRRRFKMLKNNGWLTKVEEKIGGKRRGAVEHFYRATGPAIYSDESWANVPASIKPTYSWIVFNTLSEKFKEAILAGTFEARLDNHLTWSVLRLDQIGWEKVAGQVNSLFALILKEKDRAEERLAASDEEPITTTVALAAFESPKDGTKAP